MIKKNGSNINVFSKENAQNFKSKLLRGRFILKELNARNINDIDNFQQLDLCDHQRSKTTPINVVCATIIVHDAKKIKSKSK